MPSTAGRIAQLASKLPVAVAGTDPAAGAQIVQTVPNGETWLLLGVRFTLVTSAVVANRRVKLQVDDGTNISFVAAAGAQQTAAAAVSYSYLAGVGTQTISQDQELMVPLPANGVWLPAGWRVQTVLTSGDVGDNFGAPVFTYFRLPD